MERFVYRDLTRRPWGYNFLLSRCFVVTEKLQYELISPTNSALRRTDRWLNEHDLELAED